MSLEKREIFPNRFRYVCGTCSFNWPRTPLPQDELPPAPKHSCPNAAGSSPNEAPATKPTPPANNLVVSGLVAANLVAADPQLGQQSHQKDASNSSVQRPVPEAKAEPPEEAASAAKASVAETKPAKESIRRTKSTKVAPAAVTQNSPTTKRRPVAVCTRCGAVSYDVPQINGRCANEIARKRCVGVNGSALHQDDWKLCPKCSGSGTIDQAPCGTCNSVGWLYTRHTKRR